MKIHEATEQAYKNGYEKGHKDGYLEGFVEGQKHPLKYGRWLDGGKTLFGKQKNYICSHCHSRSGVVKSNYCLNCGAKMVGGADDGKT